MPKTLIFIENKNAIQFLVGKASETAKNDYAIIPLTPHVEYELEKRGISYKRQEDYFNEEIYETIGEENIQRAKAFSQYLDDYLQKYVELLRTHDIKVTTFCLFYFKIFFDTVNIPLYSIRTILNSEQPDIVIFEATQKEPVNDNLYWIKESGCSRVIEFLCRREKINYRCISIQDNSINANVPQKKVLLKIKKSIRGLSSLWKDIGGWKAGASFWKAVVGIRKKGAGHYLFLSLSGNMRSTILGMLSSPRYEVWIWKENCLIHSLRDNLCSCTKKLLKKTNNTGQTASEQHLKSIAEALKNDETFRSFFKDSDIDWFAVVEARIDYFIIQVVRKSIEVYHQAVSVLEAIKPDALILGSVVGYRVKTIAHAAKQREVAVVTQHHGDLGTHYDPSYYYHDIVSTDYYFTYGEGVNSYLNRRYPDVVKPVAVGYPALDRIQCFCASRKELCDRFGLDKDKKIAVYVLTGLRGKHQYFSHNKPSDSSYYRINRRIVSVFEAFGDVQLVIKGQQPSVINCQSPVEDYVRDVKKSNWKVISSAPFSELINLADVFIMDSPTTILLQAITTDVPVYVYNNTFMWEACALELLKKRAYFSDDLDEFCKMLENGLGDGSIFEKKKTDDSFLRHFGIPYRDGKSTERFLEALRKISSFNKDVH